MDVSIVILFISALDFATEAIDDVGSVVNVGSKATRKHITVDSCSEVCYRIDGGFGTIENLIGGVAIEKYRKE